MDIRIIRNGDTLQTNAWLTDSTAWTTAYIEERGALGLCPNPYVFDGKRSTMTQYTYDSALHQFKLILLKNRADTFFIQIRQQDPRSMQWNGLTKSSRRAKRKYPGRTNQLPQPDQPKNIYPATCKSRR
jgi:hypothetical protein